MGHDEMLQVLKEKMRLEGQLESLSSEANQVFFLFQHQQTIKEDILFVKILPQMHGCLNEFNACLFQRQQDLCSLFDHTDLLSTRL